MCVLCFGFVKCFDHNLQHAKHASICLDPGVGVVQVASVLNYNKRKMFARKIADDIVYSPALVKLPRTHLDNLRRGISSPQQKLRLEFEQVHGSLWTNGDAAAQKVGNLLKFAHTDIAQRASNTAAVQNKLLNEPLFRNTVLLRDKALVCQSHMTSIMFVSKAMQPGTGIQSRDPRLTILSSVKPKSPSSRRIPTVNPAPSAVQAFRFFAQPKPSTPSGQMHDLFVFGKNTRAATTPANAQAPPTQEPSRGIYEGVVKITSDGARPSVTEMIRFTIGNKEVTDRFVRMYEKLSEREGKKLIHLNESANAARNKEDKIPSNFISLDPMETERQRHAVKAANKNAPVPPPNALPGGLGGSNQRVAPVVAPWQASQSSSSSLVPQGVPHRAGPNLPQPPPNQAPAHPSSQAVPVQPGATRFPVVPVPNNSQPQAPQPNPSVMPMLMPQVPQAMPNGFPAPLGAAPQAPNNNSASVNALLGGRFNQDALRNLLQNSHNNNMPQ
eukprot:TRINITY_DN4821_c0_g1_i3.p1 TRINITY_DN4821_c0_g1~~TRINITY_DN4821_c0_g1_i3.p1  ORF type:complete len:499 (+),score=114.30 TRINITY_DN4821_c0_g1_i3:260-1756(+)